MDQNLAAAIAARPAPKVTPDRIANVIVGEAYHRLTATLTVCVLTLANGFTVTGESACASPENYDEAIGNALARKQAESKIWAFEGYVLREKLQLVEAGSAPSVPDMSTFVGTKAVHAKPMSRGDYNTLRGWAVPSDEDPSDEGYLIEYADGGAPNLLGFTGYVSWSPRDVFERAYSRL